MMKSIDDDLEGNPQDVEEVERRPLLFQDDEGEGEELIMTGDGNNSATLVRGVTLPTGVNGLVSAIADSSGTTAMTTTTTTISATADAAAAASTATTKPPSSLFRSRKTHSQRKRGRNGAGLLGGVVGGGRGGQSSSSTSASALTPPPDSGNSASVSASAILPSNAFNNCMNLIARMVLWGTIVSLAAAVVWYSYELFNHGTDPHLIAWFSAGAFVLLGFPISMFGIVSHLANYNQPHVQVYIVRILWMVPIYSIESWLAMRFHKQAIYIETLRDLYESYVLYSFLQFLIQVLGGEEALILMLKDKSPTRGVHMWGLQWCVKPWLMGQPVRKISIYVQREQELHSGNLSDDQSSLAISGGDVGAILIPSSLASNPPVHAPTVTNGATSTDVAAMEGGVGNNIKRGGGHRRAMKRVHWKSPFFIKCKFGVLQYVLLKIVSTVAIFILELYGLYKEGNFTPKGGYLYICILTNLSQCWALYCMIFFYYATKNELAPIRPVGKFLSVKSLVFFTWWQSVGIAILYQMNFIPKYQDYSPEVVSKALQDYLICIEMFLAAVVHIFVFPHSEYSPQAVQARTKALAHIHPTKWNHKKKRLGRKYYNLWKDDGSKSSTTNDNNLMEMELATYDSGNSLHTAEETWSGRPSGFGGTVSPMMPGGRGLMTNDAPAPALPMQGRSPSRSRTSSLDSNDSLHMNNSWELEDDIMRQQPLAIAEEDEEQNSEHNSLLGRHGGGNGRDDDSDCDSDDEGYDIVDAPVNNGNESDDADTVTSKNPGFVRALLDSAIPLDLGANTMGIVKGDYRVEKKTLLHHAATSDQYDIFSHRRQRPFKRKPKDET